MEVSDVESIEEVMDLVLGDVELEFVQFVIKMIVRDGIVLVFGFNKLLHSSLGRGFTDGDDW